MLDEEACMHIEMAYSSAIKPPYKAEKPPDLTGPGKRMQLSELQAF